MHQSFLRTLPAALSLALAACNSGGASRSTTGSPAAADDTRYLTITSAQNGSKRHIAIPTEPAGDFGDPTSPVDEDVGMQGYTDGINAIKALAADAATGKTPGQAFAEIMTQTALSQGSDGQYAPVRFGSILLVVWYQRHHPGTSFADAAAAVEQSQPDIRKIKKAAHVARIWLADLAARPDNSNADTPTPAAAPVPTPETIGNADTANIDTADHSDPDAVYQRGIAALHSAGMSNAQINSPASNNKVSSSVTAESDSSINITNPHYGMGREALDNFLKQCLIKNNAPSQAVTNGAITTIAYSNFLSHVVTEMRKKIPTANYIMAVGSTNGELPRPDVWESYWVGARKLLMNEINHQRGGYCTVSAIDSK